MVYILCQRVSIFRSIGSKKTHPSRSSNDKQRCLLILKMNIANVETREIRLNKVVIQYDYVPKYCFECKMQGDNNDNYKVINGEHNTQRTQDKDQINHEPQVAKVHKLHKGGAKIFQVEKWWEILATGM
ncbi:hypothetical protein H5410_022720 [Solanum commersonii]|uniref:Uncharacterized protein n=1 Tax=Solanum commersonii TaxID=4109 RepID=A0A9J5ZHL2_SOLCO|nr:hypothetical protein H5410_022720 [Solanum commersonii]